MLAAMRSMELVPFKQKHIREIHSWIKTEADMIQWAGSTFVWPLTQKQFREHLKAARIEHPSLYPFSLEKRGKVVGYCEISDHRRRYNSAMLSRVIISARYRQKDLGKFMVKQALQYAFSDLGLNRLGLGVFDSNETAIRCYTKAGFVLEGTLRQVVKVGNSYWNYHLMSVLRKEWKC
jgi:RimJ/RimL family protein N-acetyltransferase